MTHEWQAEELELDPVGNGELWISWAGWGKSKIGALERSLMSTEGIWEEHIGKMEKAENMVTLTQVGIRALGQVVAR